MLISLNWLRDFVDIPADLDPRDLALKFTLTTAEVEGVEHFQPNFEGLVAGKIEAVASVEDEAKLKRVSIRSDKTHVTLSTAPDLAVGDIVIYAPPGAKISGHAVGEKDTAGRQSEGMIVAGQSLGLVQVGANALFLPPSTKAGSSIDAAIFDDWIVEIDNKSITHRPDCWGHYGIAREMAAMLELPLREYEATPIDELCDKELPEIPIEIDDPKLCPRYSGLLMKGLRTQPSPLSMQVRLAMCGQRPIDLLVDLTNYVMLEIGQPMHAFDGATLPNIQVANAAPGEQFTTLDGVTRTMPPNTLMIQSSRKSVALAGIMGGAATEVSDKTETVLLESANFDAPTIRRAATAMGHRTEASSRFEKSLDPANTVIGIARFHLLAKRELPGLKPASTLSDCYPVPKTPSPIVLDCAFASRIIGKEVPREQIVKILSALEFTCEASSGNKLMITPPSYRATKDIEIEADLIEEVARFVGYNNIDPELPIVSARYLDPSPELAIESRTLQYLCVGGDFNEVHNYIWYDDTWLATLGFEPGECITLKNPAADNCSRFRKTLMPGLIAMAERNRHHFSRFQLVEIGSVFAPGSKTVEESQHRNMGLVAVQAGKKADGEVWDRLRSALDGWARQILETRVQYREAQAAQPWEDADRIAEIVVDGRVIGRVTILPLTCKQKIDERLKAWSIALAELNLTAVSDLIDRHENLPSVPRFPQVRQDYSFVVDAGDRYEAIEGKLATFTHPLLRRVSFVEAFEGGALPPGKRSLAFRAEIGCDDRTLTEDEIHDFQEAFKAFLSSNGMELRGVPA